MEINYDPEEDRLRIILRRLPVSSADEIAPGVHVYFDQQANVVAVDVDEASSRVDDPRNIIQTEGEE